MDIELVKSLREAAERFIHGAVSLQINESRLIEKIGDLEKEKSDKEQRLKT